MIARRFWIKSLLLDPGFDFAALSRPLRPLRRRMGCDGVAVGFTSIPIIDIEPLVATKGDLQDLADSEALKVVREIDDACRNVGFFYVKGHGVPLDLLDGVREVGREFFSLPTEDKLHIGMSSASGFRGYQKMGENVTKGIPDLHEAVDYFRDWNGRFPQSMSGHPLFGHNQWPATPERFQPLLQQYLQVMQDLGKKIMQGIGLALNESPDTFEGKRAGDPFWLLRMIGYPPIPGQKVEDVGCGEHTDYGLLTLVNQDDNIKALQVKNQAGDWIWADPIPGTFVVNIGDMLKIWSNGIYLPTVHRVLNNDSMYRVSVPYFYEGKNRAHNGSRALLAPARLLIKKPIVLFALKPNFDALVEPLETCKERTGGKSKYGAVVYGDHVTSKVLTNFG